VLYLIFKALHIIFVIAWMAGMMIYPRYKIHQLSSRPGEPLFDTLMEASNRLRRVIMSPSIVLTWVFGIAMLISNPGWLEAGWLHLKLVLVVALSALHGWFVTLGKRIDAGAGTVEDGPSARRMRMLNEVPFLLLIGIVLLVVLKPF